MAEYDRLGRDAFLKKYGFSKANRYFLTDRGKLYDSKAILGVAYGIQYPQEGPLTPHDFTGGERTVVRRLLALGFETIMSDDREKEPLSAIGVRGTVGSLGVESRTPEISAIAARSGLEFDLGVEYRPADEDAIRTDVDPFTFDSADIERGVRGHAVTQNRLAGYLRGAGIDPRSPGPVDCNFDLAWSYGGTVYVAEVKSLTSMNEEKQLRLGLGQVLRYAHNGTAAGPAVPVLAVERRPSDPTWAVLCAQLGVILAWPEVFSTRLGAYFRSERDAIPADANAS
ncbi:MAG TPA: hypothetical protein VNH18_19960 [Bryobacteraceae bacterium]|nr:hypothetical protein [Bryobacteraceae bacterium]